jgi:hypothetical protein
MELSLFKKLPVQAPHPHAAALQDTKRAISALQDKMRAVVEKDTAARNEIQAADAAAGQVTQLRVAIDQIVADARYREVAPPDLTEQRRALADAVSRHERRAAVATSARAVRPRYAADLATINAEVRTLCDQLPRLVHAAAVEEMVELAVEFREKEESFRAVHARVFARAALADRIAMAEKMGVFQGAAVFGDMYVSRPNHPAYKRGSADPWTAKVERDTEWRALDSEADRLHHTLLTGETA